MMASQCREFGISRKTGYKIFERYEQSGLEGLSDRTRRPFRYANQLPEQVEAAIVASKRGSRTGEPVRLVPAASTVHAVLANGGAAWISRRLLQPGAGDASRPYRAACAAGSIRSLPHRSIRALSAKRGGTGSSNETAHHAVPPSAPLIPRSRSQTEP